MQTPVYRGYKKYFHQLLCINYKPQFNAKVLKKDKFSMNQPKKQTVTLNLVLQLTECHMHKQLYCGYYLFSHVIIPLFQELL